MKHSALAYATNQHGCGGQEYSGMGCRFFGRSPLDPLQVAEIARALEMPIERAAELDFFLEPFEAPQKVAS